MTNKLKASSDFTPSDPFHMHKDFGPFLTYLVSHLKSPRRNCIILSFYIMGATGMSPNEVRNLNFSQVRLLANFGKADVTNIRHFGARCVKLNKRPHRYLKILFDVFPPFPFDLNVPLEDQLGYYLWSIVGRPQELLSNKKFNALMNEILRSYSSGLPATQLQKDWTLLSFRKGYFLSSQLKGKASRIEQIEKLVNKNSYESVVI